MVVVWLEALLTLGFMYDLTTFHTSDQLLRHQVCSGASLQVSAKMITPNDQHALHIIMLRSIDGSNNHIYVCRVTFSLVEFQSRSKPVAELSGTSHRKPEHRGPPTATTTWNG